MNVVVILSDDEAANVAAILRRNHERLRRTDHNPAYVDDRGPTDFARQLEALVDAGYENVYVPLFALGDAPAASAAFVTRTDADTFAAKNDVPHVQKVPLFGPDDADDPDDPELITDGGHDDGPSFFQKGPLAVPIPDHATRSTPIDPPEFDEHAKRCPECDANFDPWVGENVVGVSFDITVVNGQVAAVVEAACTCGWEDRQIIGADA